MGHGNIQGQGDTLALTMELAEAKKTIAHLQDQLNLAIRDSIVRCCDTCSAHTRGTFNGKCMTCSLCECVPEVFKAYHKVHYTKSLWEWRQTQ